MNNNQKKNNKKNDINIKTIWKAFRSEQGKRYSFIIFYFFFFLFLFIFINTTDTSVKPSSVIKEDSSLPFVTKILENNSYKFNYIVVSNLNKIDYLGEKKNNIIYIKDDTGTYEFKYVNGKLTTNDNINILYKELFDIYEIKRIIKSSKLISETKLNETDEYIYKYTITNESLNNILNNNITSLDNINEIEIKTNNKKEIESIEFNLLNYEKELKSEISVFKISLEIGDIDE